MYSDMRLLLLLVLPIKEYAYLLIRGADSLHRLNLTTWPLQYGHKRLYHSFSKPKCHCVR